MLLQFLDLPVLVGVDEGQVDLVVEGDCLLFRLGSLLFTLTFGRWRLFLLLVEVREEEIILELGRRHQHAFDDLVGA
jgi:hypothetical protein